MRSCAFLVGLLLCAVAGCAPKPVVKPLPPPPPPPAELGEACKPADGGQGNCATGLACTSAGGGAFCASACPCSGGGVCAASPDAPEMCLKACTADADCKSGLKCNAEWKACAPEGMLAIKPPACTAPAVARKAFAKVTPISSSKAGKATHSPAAALDRDGNLVTVYVAGAGAGTSTLASAKATVGNDIALVEGDHALTFDREHEGHPEIARDRTGKLYLSFLGWNGATQKSMMVGLATSDDGVTWSKAVVANDASTDCAGDVAGCLDKPMVVVGPERKEQKTDVVYVFYWSAVTNSLRATHSTDGGQTFSPSAQVGNGKFAGAEVTSSGKVHVVFVSGPGNKMGDTANGIYYTNSGDGGESFAPPVRISSQNEAVPYFFGTPRVIVDVPRKMLYAVYTAGTSDGKWEIVLQSSKDAGITWSRESVNDDAPCATHLLPAATVDPSTGKLHIAWLENRTGGGGVAYVTCAPGGASCAKNEAVSDAPFAAFGFGHGTSASLGEGLALVADTKHRLVHALWTQPVDEGGTPTSRIFHSAAKLR